MSAARNGGFGPGKGKRSVEKAKDTKGTIKRLWKYIEQNKVRLIIVFILVIISSVASILSTSILKPIIDDYIIPKDWNGLLIMIGVMIALAIINSLITLIQNRIMVKMAQITVRELRKDVFNKLVKLPIKFYDTHSHGELMSRITNDLQNVTDVLSGSIVDIFSGIITFVGVTIAMLVVSPALTVLNLLAIPVIVFITSKVSKINRKQFMAQQEELGKINGFIEERISGQYVVKAFEMEEKSVNEFVEINDSYRKVGIKAEAFAGLVMPLARNLNGITYAITVIIAGILGVRGKISIGDFTTFTKFARHFGQPINQIANQFSSIQLGLASAERCFEIIDEKEEMEDDSNKVKLDKVDGNVKLDGVYFSYEEGKPILKNINIDAKKGEVIALVGPTGAGKTTIVNLLTRFYDVNKGKITIDGNDIKDIDRKSLREAIGMVLQDTVLFAESVKDNILYGKLDATDEEVKLAAQRANADEFINHLHDGYDTKLNEDGSNLSIGQKQLLNIARVFINQPKILILDEATSNVDTRTEYLINNSMKELMKNKTSIVIAHRLSTIVNSDKIIVIKRGEIIEEGTHKELLKNKGYYYELYNSQFDLNDEE